MGRQRRPLQLIRLCSRTLSRDGRASQNPSHCRLCRALPDLGLDLSRNSFRHPIDPAVLDGGRAFSSRRADHVRDRTNPRSTEIDIGRVANGADHRCVSVVRRKRRRNALGKVYRIGAGQSDCRDRPDLHYFARLVVRHDSTAGTNRLGRTGRRIFGRRNSARSSVTIFRQWSSRDWDVDLALVVVHLVGGFALFAHRKARRVTISGRCPTNVLRWPPVDARRIVCR